MTNGGCSLTSAKNYEMALIGAEDVEFSSCEEYLENEVHSPTDTSEDSVEVKVSAISLISKRKRLDTVKCPDTFTGPLKKRMCLKVKAEIGESHPFRPWSPKPSQSMKNELISCDSVSDNAVKIEEHFPVPPAKDMCQPKLEPHFSYFRPPSPVQFYQNEPVPLVKKREICDDIKTESDNFQDVRVPVHPQIKSLSTAETERLILKTNEIFPSLKNNPTDNLSNNKKSQENNQRRDQRNYKNMTRERRIEANARERTRVHTISAAFDTLRRSIPSYSHNQKLSKLSVLRIACSYIMTLSSIVNQDSNDAEEPSTSECVDMVSRTIQREGKLRKKKDDND